MRRIHALSPSPKPRHTPAPDGGRGACAVRQAGLVAVGVRALAVLWLSVSALPAGALDPDKRLHQYVANRWSIEQGLPQITVAALAQDSAGYLWVGTHAGAARFDGIRFSNVLAADHPGMPGGMVQSMAATADGTVWIGTYKGLGRWRQGRLDSLPLADAPEGAVLDVFQVRVFGEQVHVASSAGALRVEGEALARVALPRDEPVFGLAVVDATTWYGATGGLWRKDGSGNAWLRLPEDHAQTRVRHIHADAEDRLWIGTARGLFRLAPGDSQPQPVRPNDARFRQPIEAMLEDRQGNLWIASADHLFRFRGGRLQDSAGPGHPLIPGGLRSLHEDREGNLWLGSQTDGVTRLWNGWTHRHSQAEGLHEPVLWSVARRPDGAVLLGSADGLSVLEGDRIRLLVPGAALPHPHAYTLLVDGEALWIGTRGGLVRMDDGQVHTPPGFEALDGLQVNGLLRTGPDDLWIASTGGLFHHRDGQLTRHGTDAGLADVRVRVLLDDGEAGLLLGTQSGLYRFVDGRARREGVELGLPADIDVTAITRLSDGGLLLGTIGETLHHFDGRRWALLARDTVVPPNAAFHIAEDSHGWVWVAGIRGVYRVPREDFARFQANPDSPVRAEMLLNERGTYRGGQKGYCCNGAGNAKGFMHQDRLWLPSRDGLVSISAADIERNPIPPPVLIERVMHGGHSIDAPGADLGTLPGEARDIGFEFTAITLQQPDSVEIHHRLLGYDEAWTTLEDIERRRVAYTNLPPGDYVFEVRGANNAGVWNPEPARVAFSIRPRFHETGWFLLAIVLAGAALGWGVSRLRIRVLRQRQRELEAQIAERTSDLAAANLRLEAASLTDPLTGLHNRRYLQEQLPHDIAFYARELAHPDRDDPAMVLAIADIDHFKRINDRHGHLAGDAILREFSELLRGLVRNGDYVVRWGGEEFLLVMRPMPRSQAERIMERIRAAVAGHGFALPGGGRLQVTCSIGFVNYPFVPGHPGIANWESLIELADRALYAAKRGGRNAWASWQPKPEADAAAIQRDLEGDLDALVARADMVLRRPAPAPPEQGSPGQA